MDMVIFEISAELYALAAQNVPEVLDPLKATMLPYVPDYVDGLVNVAGRVMVQVDLGMRLGVAGRLAAESGNVLVIDCRAGRTAAHVERVLAKADIPAEQLNLYAPQDEVSNRIVTGEFLWHDRTVLVLDPEAVGIDEMRAVGVPDAEGGLLGLDQQTVDDEEKGAGRIVDGFACLLVDSCAERYAFRFTDVWEVVEGGSLTLVPKAPVEVAGIALLRGQPIPAISLGRLLSGRAADAAETQMVIVERAGAYLGLLVERVAGIGRFGEAEIQRIVSDQEDVEGYLCGLSGKMTGLLSLANLFSEERLLSYRGFMVACGTREAASALRVETRQMLTFLVGGEHCALPMSVVERIEERQLETQTPDIEGGFLAGVVQIRGNVTPVLDLRREMALGTAGEGTGTYLVVRVQDGFWALVVDRVERMVEFAVSDIDEVKGAANDYVAAVGRFGGRLYSVLTVAPILRSLGEAAA